MAENKYKLDKRKNALVATVGFPSEPSIGIQAVYNSNTISVVSTMAGYN